MTMRSILLLNFAALVASTNMNATSYLHFPTATSSASETSEPLPFENVFHDCLMTSRTRRERNKCFDYMGIGPLPRKRHAPQRREAEQQRKGTGTWALKVGNVENGGLVTSIMAADTLLSLINATPYRWNRTHVHQYQMKDWEDQWPQHMEPGKTSMAWAKACRVGRNCGDTAGEVQYTFENTSKPMALTLRYKGRRKGEPQILVSFEEQLESLNNARHSKHKLPFLHLPGGSGFVVAGDEAGFITNDGPLGWMQAMLPELGARPLREIVLPRSHHAGLHGGKTVGMGSRANAQVQRTRLKDQLGNGGVRVLDVRAARGRDGVFHESHISKVGGGAHGMLGARISDMVDAINRFTKKTPGELILVDVHGDAPDGTRGWQPLNLSGRIDVYDQLLRLNDRLPVPDGEDVTLWPLNRFIGNRTTAVLVLIDDRWRADDADGFPGGKQGFVTGRNFPLTHRWSNTASLKAMVDDQVRSFRELRKSRASPIHVADWVLTQSTSRAVIPEPSLLELAAQPWGELFGALWERSDSESYPNWVAVDGVQGNMHKSVVMAMNHCLVAKRCGELGGKVKLDPPPAKEREKEDDFSQGIRPAENM